MKIRNLSLAVLFCFILAGCHREKPGVIPENPGPIPPLTAPTATASPQVLGAVQQSANAFGMDLFRELMSDNRGNVFFSPATIYTCLAMAQAGASGTTAQQMAATMKIILPPETFHPELGRLIFEMRSSGSADTL